MTGSMLVNTGGSGAAEPEVNIFPSFIKSASIIKQQKNTKRIRKIEESERKQSDCRLEPRLYYTIEYGIS